MKTEEQEMLFHVWLRNHIGLIFKVVRGCAATPDDQEDLFQDVLVNLWSSIPNFQGESKETTWIYRVAFKTSLTWRRSERRRRKKHALFINNGIMLQRQVNADVAQDRLEIIERLYSAIRQLPKIDASLALMHLDGMSYQEMSEVLGISENYVGVKLTRIRKQLAEILQGVEDELR